MRALYLTTCTNHSGGPASPHTVDCFVMFLQCKHGWIDGHWTGRYIDKTRGQYREYRIWCDGANLDALIASLTEENTQHEAIQEMMDTAQREAQPDLDAIAESHKTPLRGYWAEENAT